MAIRSVQQVLQSHISPDGEGLHIRRTVGKLRHDMDPFLMLDEIRATADDEHIGGFPLHPHRGIETLTYIVSGGFVQEDSLGNRQTLPDGGAQWTSAARGVIHSERPLIQHGLLHGFQLWINLPAQHKMNPPQYEQATREALPELRLPNGTHLRCISGSWEVAGHSLQSPLHRLAAHARILDITLLANVSLSLDVPTNHTILAYLFDGSLVTGANSVVRRQQTARYSNGEQLVLQAGNDGARLGGRSDVSRG